MLLRGLIGTVLRRTRQAQGRTLRHVADAARVSVPYLSEVERGRKEPSSELLAAICAALALELTDLLSSIQLDLAEAEFARRQLAGRQLAGHPLPEGHPGRMQVGREVLSLTSIAPAGVPGGQYQVMAAA